MNNEILKYLNAAAGDKLTYEQLMEVSNKRQYQSICFHAQQCAEKTLKALWLTVYPEKKIEHTHDILSILKVVSEKCDVNKELIKQASYLTKYAVDARYDFVEKIDENQAMTSIYNSNKISSWALDRIHEHEQSLDTKARKPSQTPEKHSSMSTQGRSPEK